MSRAMSDIQNVRMFLGYGLVFFTINVFSMVAVTVLLFVLNWQLALLTLAFFPLLLIVALRFSRRLQPDPARRAAEDRRRDRRPPRRTSPARASCKIFAREDDELEPSSATRSTRGVRGRASAPPGCARSTCR